MRTSDRLVKSQILKVYLFSIVATTVHAEVNISCNILNEPEAISICEERISFSEEILKEDITQYSQGFLGLGVYDQSDRIKDLIDRGDFLGASKQFNNHKSFFKEVKNKKQHHEYFTEIATHINNLYRTEMFQIEKHLIALEQRLTKRAITASEGYKLLDKLIFFVNNAKEDYQKHHLLNRFDNLVFVDSEKLISNISKNLSLYQTKKRIANRGVQEISLFEKNKWDYVFLIVLFGWFVYYLLNIFLPNKDKDYSAQSNQSKENLKPHSIKTSEDDKKKEKILYLWKSRAQEAKDANISLEGYLNPDVGYFSNYEELNWLYINKKLFNLVSRNNYQEVGLEALDIEVINNFIANYKGISSLRKNFNKVFVEREILYYRDLFNNIEGRKLDDQQRKAVVVNEDNNLVIAGAGSGKTTTIVAKVRYLLDKYNVDPEKILLISFTRNSATDLKKRIAINNIEVKTFHKFGMDVLTEVEQKKPSIFDQQKFKPLLSKLLNQQLKSRSYLKKVNTFITEYLKIPKRQSEFRTKGDYYQYLRDQDFKTFKYVKLPGRTTLHREVVKSIEECKIANFLLFNGVEYEYEANYQYNTANVNYRQYRPDFTIFQDGKRVYLEHFGINKNKQVPYFFAQDGETITQASKRYINEMKWKVNLHKENSTKLIKTYSYELWKNDEIFYENLKKRLVRAGIKLKPKTPEEIWQIVNSFYQEQEHVLVDLFERFIVLMKSNQYSISSIKQKIYKKDDGFLAKRSELFLDMITPVYSAYESCLDKDRSVDFSDMINKATRYLADRKYFKKYNYIIIDEFQDISIGRYNLIKELKNNNPECKLFCVGDDWQSIYRFTGSDIALFKDFEKYFGVTERLKIETTYRFHNPLIDLSSGFIQKNPNQSKKDLKSFNSRLRTSYQIRYSNNDDTNTLVDIFNELIGMYENIEEKEIIIISRNNRDLEDRVQNEDGALSINKEGSKTIVSFKKVVNEHVINLQSKFQTIHSSKGLEADVVIILRCNSEVLGLPSQISDDPLLNLLLSESDQFENGEERRLFYVAMTRAKENLYLVTDTYKKSKFITEIESENKHQSNIKCILCKKGDMVPRMRGIAKNGNKYVLYGCTNFKYSCKNNYRIFENQSNWIEEDY